MIGTYRRLSGRLLSFCANRPLLYNARQPTRYTSTQRYSFCSLNQSTTSNIHASSMKSNVEEDDTAIEEAYPSSRTNWEGLTYALFHAIILIGSGFIFMSDKMEEAVKEILEDSRLHSSEDIWLSLVTMCTLNNHPIDFSTLLVKAGLLEAVKRTLEDNSSITSCSLALHVLSSVAENHDTALIIAQDKELLRLIVEVINAPASAEHGNMLMSSLEMWTHLLRHEDKEINALCEENIVPYLDVSQLWDTLRFSYDVLFGPFGFQIAASGMEVIGRMSSPDRIKEWKKSPSNSEFITKMINNIDNANIKLDRTKKYFTDHYNGQTVIAEAYVLRNLRFWTDYCKNINLDLMNENNDNDKNNNDTQFNNINQFISSRTYKQMNCVPWIARNLDLNIHIVFFGFSFLYGFGRGAVAVGRYYTEIKLKSSQRPYILLKQNPWLYNQDILSNKLRIISRIAVRTAVGSSIISPIIYMFSGAPHRPPFKQSSCDNKIYQLCMNSLNLAAVCLPVIIIFQLFPYIVFPALTYQMFMLRLNDENSPVLLVL